MKQLAILLLLLVAVLLSDRRDCPVAPPVISPVVVSTPVVHVTELIVFSAKWCGPCQRAKPVVDQLEASGFVVKRIDIDEQSDLAKQYHITSIPTFILHPNTKHELRTQDISTVLAELKHDE